MTRLKTLASSRHRSLSRSPLNELLQIASRCHAQHKPSVFVRDDREFLALATGGSALEERLEFLERRVHCDDLVLLALTLEAVHGGADGVLGLDATGVEERLELGDGEVAEQTAGLGIDDGEVGVVALESSGERKGDWVRGGEGEGGWGLKVFYCGLGGNMSVVLLEGR